MTIPFDIAINWDRHLTPFKDLKPGDLFQRKRVYGNRKYSWSSEILLMVVNGGAGITDVFDVTQRYYFWFPFPQEYVFRKVKSPMLTRIAIALEQHHRVK